MMSAFVESHPSQSARRMGHPASSPRRAFLQDGRVTTQLRPWASNLLPWLRQRG